MPKLSASKDFPGARQAAATAVDNAAWEMHARIRPGPTHVMQAMYLEATEFLAKFQTEADSSMEQGRNWPLLAVHTKPGVSLFVVAGAVVDEEKKWRARAARVERIRLDAQLAIGAAGDLNAIDAAAKLTWPAELLA